MRVAQKSLRTGGRTVGARLEHDDEVAGFGYGEVHPVGEQIERRAQRSDDRGRLAAGADDPISDRDRVILADHLAEVPTRREMMMEAAVGHQQYVLARDLAVDDATDVDAGFADQVA